jgi:hypothetical protein
MSSGARAAGLVRRNSILGATPVRNNSPGGALSTQKRANSALFSSLPAKSLAFRFLFGLQES